MTSSEQQNDSSQCTTSQFDVDRLPEAGDIGLNSTFVSFTDYSSTHEDSLFDEFVRSDAYVTSSPNGWTPHLLESNIDPHSPSMLFFSGTAEDLPPVYDTSAFHDHAVISVCEAAPTLAGDTLSLSAPSVHSLEIPEYSDYTIPYVSDILCPPTDLLDPCTPSESTDDSLCYRNLRVPENTVPPVATVAQVRAEGRMKRSYSPYPSSSSSGPSSRPCSRASYVSDVPISQRPRNVQVPFDIYQAVMQTHTGWECPFCDYVQTKQRTPDLKRHIATHCAEGASLHSPASSDAVVQIRCCGVPLRLASRYGISIPDTFKALVIDGVAVVGGCGMTFSRRDALLRHVSNPNNDCVDWKALQKRAGESPVKCSKKARSRT